MSCIHVCIFICKIVNKFIHVHVKYYITLKLCTAVRCEVCWVCEVTLHLAPCTLQFLLGTLHLAPCTLQFLLGTLHLAIILLIPGFFSSFIVPNNYPSIQYILCTQHECMYVSFNLSRTNMIIFPKNRNLQKIEINHRSNKIASLLAQCTCTVRVNQFVFVHPNCTY